MSESVNAHGSVVGEPDVLRDRLTAELASARAVLDTDASHIGGIAMSWYEGKAKGLQVAITLLDIVERDALASRPSEPVPPEPRLSLKEAIEGLREMMTPEDHEKINAYLLESEAPCYCKRGVYTPSADCPRHMRPVPAPIGDDTRRLRELVDAYFVAEGTRATEAVEAFEEAMLRARNAVYAPVGSGATEPNTTSEGTEGGSNG